MEFLELFDALYKREVRYLLCGGLAVSIYGIPRNTADIDLLVDFEKENLTRFLNAMKLISYVGSLPFSIEILADQIERHKLIEQKNLIAYSFFNSAKNTFLVDVLVKTPVLFGELWERKAVRKYKEIPINLIAVKDLIKLKEQAGREQDKQDIALLSKLLDS